MSNEEVCITILITFGTFHIALLIIILLIDNKIDKIQKILKKLATNNMNILTDKFLRKRKIDQKNKRRIN